MFSRYIALLSIIQADQEIASHLKTQPAAGHTGSNFEKIWPYPLEKSTEAFLGHYNPDSIPD